MKKIFTLLFSVGLLTSAIAQSNHSSQNGYPGRDDQNSGYNKNTQPPFAGNRNDHSGYNDRHTDFSVRMRDEQIAKINYEYDSKINAIKYRRGGLFFDKNRKIRNLEIERQDQIRMVYARFSGKNNYGGHNERDNNRRY
jgi:hypothetical protein